MQRGNLLSKLQVKNKMCICPAKNLRFIHTNLGKWLYFDVFPTGLHLKKT